MLRSFQHHLWPLMQDAHGSETEFESMLQRASAEQLVLVNRQLSGAIDDLERLGVSHDSARSVVARGAAEDGRMFTGLLNDEYQRRYGTELPSVIRS